MERAREVSSEVALARKTQPRLSWRAVTVVPPATRRHLEFGSLTRPEVAWQESEQSVAPSLRSPSHLKLRSEVLQDPVSEFAGACAGSATFTPYLWTRRAFIGDSLPIILRASRILLGIAFA